MKLEPLTYSEATNLNNAFPSLFATEYGTPSIKFATFANRLSFAATSKMVNEEERRKICVDAVTAMNCALEKSHVKKIAEAVANNCLDWACGPDLSLIQEVKAFKEACEDMWVILEPRDSNAEVDIWHGRQETTIAHATKKLNLATGRTIWSSCLGNSIVTHYRLGVKCLDWPDIAFSLKRR